LRADELLGLWLSLVEFSQHLFRGISALAGVTLDLPLAADVLRRVEVDGDVEARLGQPGVQR
jgi:hypothetical protein